MATRQVKAELGAEDRAYPDAGLFFAAGSGLGELGSSVHAIVVSDGERLYSAPGRLRDQFGGLRRPIQEAVRRNGSAVPPMAPGAACGVLVHRGR